MVIITSYARASNYTFSSLVLEINAWNWYCIMISDKVEEDLFILLFKWEF